MCSFAILFLNQQNDLNFCTALSVLIPSILYSQSYGAASLSNGSFSKLEGFMVFQCHLRSFYESDILWFISIHGLSYQLLQLHIFHCVLGCLGVTFTKRSIHMSLCLLVNGFLIMFTYASNLHNIPVGNPAELVTFAVLGKD